MNTTNQVWTEEITHDQIISAIRPEDTSIDPAFGELPLRAAVYELKIHQDLKSTKSIIEFDKKIRQYIQACGLADYSYIRCASKDTETQLITTARDMTKVWMDEGLWQYDYMTMYASSNTNPIFQSTIDSFVNKAPFETVDIQKNRLLQENVKAYRYYEYYNIPLKAGNGNGNVLLSVTARDMEPRAFRQRICASRFTLRILARSIDHVGTQLYPEYLLDSTEPKNLGLKPRAIELLNCLAWDNLSLAEAAEKLCMSMPNANRLVAAVKKAVGATTLPHAMYRAIKSGIVDLE
jgi:hypothetical protein